MLRSLEIRNYRNLRHLTIDTLGRVNLLTGKNNSGKTSVLEAVYFWANNGRYDVIYEVLEAREGVFESTAEERYQRNKLTLASMFSGRETVSLKEQSIYIETNNDSRPSSLTLGFQEGYSGNEGPQLLAFSIKHTNVDRTLSIPLYQTINPKDLDFSPHNWPVGAKNQFVKSTEVSKTNVGTLYDEITTTDWEEEVVNALKIIDSRISKLAFRTDVISNKRYPVVRLEGSKNPLPLRSMGDGINRILTIILAMVNCENGYLLIDEFENGLHYSVQEKLWEIIFYLAERLNIQVFATTHSLDCVEAFSTVLNDGKQDKDAGVMIRLENYEGNIEATVYDADEIQATTRVHVDPR